MRHQKMIQKIIGQLTALTLCVVSLVIPDAFPVSAVEASIPTLINNDGYLQILDSTDSDTDADATAASDVECPLYQAAFYPSSYDLRDLGYVTPVRNQGKEGMCHAFAALGACESNLLRQGLETDPDTLDLSEAHMGYFLYTQQEDVLDPLYGDYIDAPGKGSDGGNLVFSAAALASGGLGTQLEEYCPYSSWGTTYSAYQRYSGRYRLRTFENLKQASTTAERNTVKKWLIQNGAVCFAYYTQRSLYYDNGSSYAYYTTNKTVSDGNHAALIVGWDDDYSRENFSPDYMPDHNGAWLVKNSYGADAFDDGYFWLSYEDPTISSLSSFVMESADDYDDIYEYDGAGYLTAYTYSAAANVFVAEYDSTLTDVAFSVPAGNGDNSTYEVSVYLLQENTDDPTDGTLAATVSGTVPCTGYYTVPLTKAVSLTQGQQFSLVIRLKKANGSDGYIPIEETVSAMENFTLRTHADAGESYILYTDSKRAYWTDATEVDGNYSKLGNIPLKALTVRNTSCSGTRLSIAISLAQQSTVTGTILSNAILQGEAVHNTSSSGVASCAYTASTLLGVLEETTGTPSFPTYQYADYDVMVGDSNADGAIGLDDAAAVLRVYAMRNAGMTVRLRRGVTYAMDAQADGSIDLADATEILQAYATAGASGGS
jgi:C1A family cysteine protease